MKRILAPILLLTLLFPSLALGGEVTIPENSFSQGANWYCHNGFKADRVNNKCISINIPKNAFAQGANWHCHNGFKADRVNNKCISINIPKNAFAQGANWYCHNGFKADRVNSVCVEMTEEEKRIQLLQIQARRQQERNHTLEYDGEEFTLRQIERKCEVYRYSENHGDLECRGFRFVERKCEAYFSDKKDKDGEIECRGSELSPIERYCTVSMYSENYGDIDC